MLEKVFGFLANKCKVEVVAKDNFKAVEGSISLQNSSATNVLINYPERIYSR